MEELKARHRKEQRDLQSQVTQKKKSASKKSRRSVNDECEELERQLKQRQERDLTDLSANGHAGEEQSAGENPEDDLLASIAAESQLNEETVPSHLPNGQKSEKPFQQQRKPNRQQQRLARRAAEHEAVVAQAAQEAASLPDLRERERLRMVEEFKKRGLEVEEVAANGHCMYSAIADQMRQLHLDPNPKDDTKPEDVAAELQKDDYKIVRRVAAAYITKNSDDFTPFLEEPLENYIHKIRDTGEWGGQLELMALAKTYNLNINVLQGDGRVEKIESGQTTPKGEVWLAYYRHGFGLGEHYNSLRKSSPAQQSG